MIGKLISFREFYGEKCEASAFRKATTQNIQSCVSHTYEARHQGPVRYLWKRKEESELPRSPKRAGRGQATAISYHTEPIERLGWIGIQNVCCIILTFLPRTPVEQERTFVQAT